MIKRMIIMLAAVALVLGGIFGFEAFRAKMIANFMASMAQPVQTVTAVTAETQSWQTTAQTVGNLRAVNGADLSLDVAGIVDQISFESGDEVKAGTPLLRLRAEDDPARLAALLAALQLADITYQRDQKQLQAQAISQAALDQDEANLRSARAQVAEQQALIEKKSLKAPFDGRLGLRAVDLGQYLGAGTIVVTLQQLNPIFVDFYLPEQSLATLRLGQKVEVGVDAFPGKIFTGKVIAVDSKVDIGSRNVQIRAKLDNADHKLVPGMYGKVAVEQGDPTREITLPASAISFNAYGSTVYIVDDKGKDEKGQPNLVARLTFVTTGQTRGDQIAILKGVKEGETIVASGQIKLRNGSRLTINNKLLPSNDPNPTTPDN